MKAKVRKIVIRKATDGKDEVSLTIPVGYKQKALPFRDEWLEALESGRFRQTTGELAGVVFGGDKLTTFNPTKKGRLKYCCLGVLCRVQGRLRAELGDEGFECYSDGGLDDNNPSNVQFFGHTGTFPSEVTARMGSDAGAFILGSLVDCNDDANLTFKEIAKIVRLVWKNGPKNLKSKKKAAKKVAKKKK